MVKHSPYASTLPEEVNPLITSVASNSRSRSLKLQACARVTGSGSAVVDEEWGVWLVRSADLDVRRYTTNYNVVINYDPKFTAHDLGLMSLQT